MKNLIAFLKEAVRIYIPNINLGLPLYKENKVIPLTSSYYSFNGLTSSSPFIPSGNDTIGFSGGDFIPDKDSSEKEVIHAFRVNKNLEYKRIREIYNKTRSIWVWIASSSIILVFAFAVIQNHVRNKEMDILFQIYYSQPDISYFGNIRVLKEEFPDWANVVKAYNEKNFSLVREYLRIVPDRSPLHEYLMFINSICLMQDHQYQQALEYLNSLNVKDNSVLKADVNWFSGLCYMKLGDIYSARILLQKITSGNLYEKKAVEILRKMNAVN
jgi:hypothetical protein